MDAVTNVPGAMGFQIMLRGGGWLLPPGADPVRLDEGDIVFRPRGRAHALADSPTARPATCDAGAALPIGRMLTLCGAYEVDPRRAHPLLHGLPEWQHVVPTGELRAVTGLLATEIRNGTASVVPALLETMLAYLLRHLLADPGTNSHAGSADPAVSVALAAMHADPGRAWTVAELAAESRLSRAAFARRFSAVAGRPPLAYLTWWRMTVAARRLRDSTDTVAVIAREAGYASEFAFATAFRRHHGLPPGQFRRAT